MFHKFSVLCKLRWLRVEGSVLTIIRHEALLSEVPISMVRVDQALTLPGCKRLLELFPVFSPQHRIKPVVPLCVLARNREAAN